MPSDTLCQNAPGAVTTITTSDRSKPPSGFDLFVPTGDTKGLDSTSNNMNETKRPAGLEKLSNTNSYTPDSWTSQTRNTFIAIMATMIVLIISLHRFCPLPFKSADLLFAGEHFIDDTVRFLLCLKGRLTVTRLHGTLTLCFSLTLCFFSTPKECSIHDLARHSPPRCPLRSLSLVWKRLGRTIYWSPPVWSLQSPFHNKK